MLQDWYNWTAEEKVLWQGMGNIHDKSKCQGRSCSYHSPSNHHMRTWPPHWRGDRGILERICDHGIGHPDPDQEEYWAGIGQQHNSVHGCDGCCIPISNQKSVGGQR